MIITERCREEFHSAAMREGYPAGAIALYNILLHVFEREHQPEALRFSERDLARYAGLSNAAVHRNLSFLVERAYITVEPRKRGTVIALNVAQAEHERSIGVAPRDFPINARAHALPPPPPPPKPPLPPTDEFEQLLTFWRSSDLMPRLFPHQEAILRKYSAAEVKEALHAAMDANRPDKDGNSGLCFAFIESFLPGSAKHKHRRRKIKPPQSTRTEQPTATRQSTATSQSSVQSTRTEQSSVQSTAREQSTAKEHSAVNPGNNVAQRAASANTAKEGIVNGVDGDMAAILSRRRPGLFEFPEGEVTGANAGRPLESVRAGDMRPLWSRRCG